MIVHLTLQLLPGLDFHIFAIQPLLTLPQQAIMLLAAMTWHIRLHFDAHHSLLTISEVTIAHGEGLQKSVVDTGDLARIDGDQLVLFVEMPDVFDFPLAVSRGVAMEKHAKTTIRFGVCFISEQLVKLRCKKPSRLSHPSGGSVNRCVMLAFILTTAREPSGVMSMELPWIRCMMKAPLSIPFCDAVMKDAMGVRPVQLLGKWVSPSGRLKAKPKGRTWCIRKLLCQTGS